MPQHASTSCSGPASGAPLGIYTKQLNAPTPRDRLARKFKLQRHAQILLPDKRVALCNRHVRMHDLGEVVGRSRNGHAEFINVLRCGSVWDCPVCASKIASSRSAVVLSAMNRALELGYQVHLLTLTVPHTLHQSAKTVITAIARARSHWKNSRLYKAHKQASGWLGEIWAYEVTYGRNGWHPHCHALIFSKHPDIESLRGQWTASVLKQGMGEVNQKGFDVRAYDGATDYVGKWGLELEVTRGDLKKSRKGGSSPFYLLEQSMKGDIKAGELFCEYSRAFHGRPQLLWTDGLKSALLVDDLDDLALAEAPEVDASLPHESWVLDQASWMVVLGKNMRGELLYYAGKYGQVGVDAFVAKLKGLADIDEPYYRQVFR